MNAVNELLSILGVKRLGPHGPCRFCGSRDAMSTRVTNRPLWKCHSCGKHGDYADALALDQRIPLKEALKRIGHIQPVHTLKPKPQITPEPIAPTIDSIKADDFFFSNALENVKKGKADRWIKRRGLSRNWIESNLLLGFVESCKIDEWYYPLENAWIIRVTTPESEGSTVALKAHRERPPDKCKKASWLPFGVEGKHGFSTFWPYPERYNANELLYLCPGELKAAAMCSAGFSATSITTGENFKWTPGAVARFHGRKVCIVFDDDPAGHNFKDTSIKALKHVVASLKAFSFGKKVTV